MNDREMIDAMREQIAAMPDSKFAALEPEVRAALLNAVKPDIFEPPPPPRVSPLEGALERTEPATAEWLSEFKDSEWASLPRDLRARFMKEATGFEAPTDGGYVSNLRAEVTDEETRSRMRRAREQAKQEAAPKPDPRYERVTPEMRAAERAAQRPSPFAD